MKRLVKLLAFSLILFTITIYAVSFAEKPYEIAVITNDTETTGGYRAIKYFVNKRIKQINQSGGINGHKVKEHIYNNNGNNDTALEQTRKILKKDNVLGIIGIWNSSRAKVLLPEIAKSEIPLIGFFSDTELYKNNSDNYQNIYTGIISLKDELRVFKKRVADRGIKRIVFVGKENDQYSEKYLSTLEELLCLGIISDLVVIKVNDVKNGERFESIISAQKSIQACKPFEEDSLVVLERFKTDDKYKYLGDKLPKLFNQGQRDMLMLSLSSKVNARVLTRLIDKNVKTTLYTPLGDIGSMLVELKKLKHADGKKQESYAKHAGIELWDTADQGIPHANNQRHEELYLKNKEEMEALGISKLNSGYGAIYADLAAILVDAANSAPANTASIDSDIQDMRKTVIKQLAEYRPDQKIFRGWSKDWTFTENRSAAINSILAWSPPGLASYILDPDQYAYKDGKLRKIHVLFTNIDVIELRDIDDKKGTFSAEFYLSIKTTFTPKNGQKIIDFISFPNTARSNNDQQQLIKYSLVDEKNNEYMDGFNFNHRLYKVSGQFTFHPELKNFPFDSQALSISIQAKQNNESILIQPPSVDVRDEDFLSQDWKITQQYVGVDQDIITSLKGYGEKVRITPFYKFNFTWIMERKFVDYFLKVLIPVLVLCIISYVAIFIPLDHFEATAGIQVTSILAAIALYFSVEKPVTSYATLSDWVFLLTYILIMLMLSLSIIYSVLARNENNSTKHFIRRIQVYGLPAVLVVVLILFSI